MKSRRGFTVLEVIVVIAIIGLLAALAAPVFVRAKRSAHETTCIANLKQAHVALELYRADWSTTEVGTPAQMGFPLSALLMFPRPEMCKGVDPMLCTSPGAYMQRWPEVDPEHPNYSEEGGPYWAAYIQEQGASALLVHDASHQDYCPQSRMSTQRVLGLTLGGSVYWKIRRGDPMKSEWWHQ